MSKPKSCFHMLVLLLFIVVAFLSVFTHFSFQFSPAMAAPSRSNYDNDHSFFYGAFMEHHTHSYDGDLYLTAKAVIVEDELLLRLVGGSAFLGGAWHLTPQQVGDGFETTFDFRLDSDGREGFAFVIRGDDPDAFLYDSPTSSGGPCDLGYEGIPRSIAIEFDTFADPIHCADIDDPNDNHISIQTNGIGPNNPAHSYSLGHYIPPFSLDNGKVHTVKIRYLVEDEIKRLEVYLYEESANLNAPAEPVLSIDIDIEATLELEEGLVWVGFTAFTGTPEYYNHDILNWHFVDSYPLTCLEYDFTIPNIGGAGSHQFTANIGGWKGNQLGWYTTDGTVQVHRGIVNTAHPILASTDGFNPRIIDMIRDPDDPLPIAAVRLLYEGISGPYDDSLTGVYNFLDKDGSHISGNWAVDPIPSDLGHDWFVTTGMIDDLVISPTGMEVGLSAPADAKIHLKRAAVCVDPGPPPRPPVLPPGSGAACQALLTNIKSRQQPFGMDGVSSQAEFQFPEEVVLAPYPEYSLNADGYPNPSLTYDESLGNPSLVPCVFMLDNQIFNPNPETPHKPIVRFTSMDPDPDMREMMTLLNYAGYFSVGSPNWCYGGDNVFSRMYDRTELVNYGPAYNVPPPRYRCDTEQLSGLNNGPCGTFVGSLFRAMGYYDVSAFAEKYTNPHIAGELGNLYYGSLAYRHALPYNRTWAGVVDKPFVRPDNSSPIYDPLPVSFSGIRVYALDDAGNRIYAPVGSAPLNCNFAEESCRAAQNIVNDNWFKSTEKALSPLHRGEPADPETLWQQIRPGDIAITVIEFAEPGYPAVVKTDYPHIQIVVGWGPKGSGSANYSPASIREGKNFFPTYAAIPDDKKQTYVPYVMDRFSLPGTGGVSGPRPFCYQIWHTATDFWITHIDDASQAELLALDSISWEITEADHTGWPLGTNQNFDGPAPAFAPSSIAWSPDGEQIALAGSFGLLLYPASLDYATPLGSAQMSAVDLSWHPDGSRLASAHATQQIKIWDTASGAELAAWQGHMAPLTGVAWGPNNDYLASSAKDGMVRLWHSLDLTLIATLPYTGGTYIETLAWNNVGDKLAGADATALYIWDVSSKELVNTIPLLDSTARSLAWSSDDQYLVTAGPQLWHVTTGESLGVYSICSAGMDDLVALSADGRYLSSAGSAQTGVSACVLELDETYHQIDEQFVQTFARMEAISDMAWHPQVAKLATSTHSGWLQLWDAVSGQLETTASRPNVTPSELEYLLVACVPSGKLRHELTPKLLDGDYDQFISQVLAQDPEMIAPGCVDQLVTTAEFLVNNPPPPPPGEITPQPLDVQGICTPDATTMLNWLIKNPNPYEVVVYWGWEELAPEVGGPPIVIPAAVNGLAGQWVLRTPVHVEGQTLRIVSGSFTATAVPNLSPCSLWLPVVLNQ